MASRKAKRENTKANTAICPICEKVVVDSGRKSQDSIFCEGSCQAWLHRCCAGLTRSRFDELSDNNTLPFHCLIWGTLRSTTVAAVTTALSKLTMIGGKLQVRRKYKTGKDNRSRWWYIVKGAEEDLCKLDSEWDHVYIQTSWKLKGCFKPMQTPLPLFHTKQSVS